MSSECNKIKKRIKEEFFIEYLEDLFNSDRLYQRGVAEGIARKILSEGTIENLTEKQTEIFIMYCLIEGNNYIDECANCSNDIHWEEMLIAMNDGYCSECYHLMNKD